MRTEVEPPASGDEDEDGAEAVGVEGAGSGPLGTPGHCAMPRNGVVARAAEALSINGVVSPTLLPASFAGNNWNAVTTPASGKVGATVEALPSAPLPPVGPVGEPGIPSCPEGTPPLSTTPAVFVVATRTGTAGFDSGAPMGAGPSACGWFSEAEPSVTGMRAWVSKTNVEVTGTRI
jgi:hypothetical protein